MTVTPIEAGKGVLILKLARNAIGGMRSEAGAIKDPEMRAAAGKVVARYEDAIRWMEELVRGDQATGVEPRYDPAKGNGSG